MVGEDIRTMLESEIKTSSEFSRRNFGLAVGDDFREMVEEIVKSKEVSALLLCGLMMGALGGKTFAESVKNDPPQSAEDDGSLRRAILANMEIFKPSMEFLYWGIQVGRKLAQAEAETFKKLEKEVRAQ